MVNAAERVGLGERLPFADGSDLGASVRSLQWIVDGYTTLENYPYAEQMSLGDATATALLALGAVAVRAFMGADALTMLVNKMIVVAIGVLLTGLVYIAITTFAAQASIRKKAIVAALASFLASCAMAGALLATAIMGLDRVSIFLYYQF